MTHIERKYYNNGNLFSEVIINNGKRQGKKTYYYKNGFIKKIGNYIDDKLEGQYIEFYKNDIYREYNYNNNKLNGIFKNFDYHKKICIISNYKNDKKEGIETILHFDGKITDIVLGICNFTNNKLNGMKYSYHINGKLKSKCNYINNLSEGEYSEYDEFSNLIRTIKYINGKKNGHTKIYRKNKINLVMNYKNNVKEGEVFKFWPNGYLKFYGILCYCYYDFCDYYENYDFCDYYENYDKNGILIEKYNSYENNKFVHECDKFNEYINYFNNTIKNHSDKCKLYGEKNLFVQCFVN
jgi:antitoxin component YwqK of YwqJK toxin-antitoxin module